MKMELGFLAIYYRDKGMTVEERKNEIYKLCEKHVEGFSRVKYFKVINSAINKSTKKKEKLIDIDSIEVYDAEVEYIDNLDLDYTYKKILFTLLVMNKLRIKRIELYREEKYDGDNYFNQGSNYLKELMDSSGVTKSELKKLGYENVNLLINELNRLGLVESTVQRLKLSFIDNISTSQKVSFKVSSYSGLGLYYDYHSEIKGIKKCARCEVPTKIKSNRTKYCDECAVDVNREKTRMRMRDSRNV